MKNVYVIEYTVHAVVRGLSRTQMSPLQISARDVILRLKFS